MNRLVAEVTPWPRNDLRAVDSATELDMKFNRDFFDVDILFPIGKVTQKNGRHHPTRLAKPRPLIYLDFQIGPGGAQEQP